MDLQIISGTNRPGNLSLGIAEQYQHLLQMEGLVTDLFSLESLPPEFLQSDLYGNRSDAFLDINNRIIATRHLLFIVPEYNGSIPGILKLFIDACDYPESFRNKEVWMVGLSVGRFGNRQGLRHLGEIMDFLGSKVDPSPMFLVNLKSKIAVNGWIEEALSKEEILNHAKRISNRILLDKELP